MSIVYTQNTSKFDYMKLHNFFIHFVEFIQIEPMVVGIWCGTAKPPLTEYLSPLIDELKSIMSNGLSINSQQINVKMGQIICDSPARSFIKGTHNQIYESQMI